MPPGVVVVGGGFGGLAASRVLEGAGADYLLVDARNHHLFQPLLYQVATGFLEGPAVAYPLRALLRRGRFLLGRVERVDLEGRRLFLEDGTPLPYRFLLLATGSLPSDLGVPGAREHALFLKTLGQALKVRYRLLDALERAAREGRPLDLLVVGGGPTGVELAGALAEFLRYALPRDFPEVPAGTVTLLEAGPRLLPVLRPALSRYAERALAHLGVEVRLGAQVAEVGGGG